MLRGRRRDARRRRRRAQRDDVRDRPALRHRRRRRALEGRRRHAAARAGARATAARDDRRLLRARGRPRQGADGARTTRSRGRGGDIVAERLLKPGSCRSGSIGEAERLGARRSTGRPRRRSSATSASASSGCCASSRSSRSSTARARTIGVEEVEARRALRRAAGLVARRRARRRATRDGALGAYLELRAQGERLPRLVPLMARRLRDVLAIAERLEAGESRGHQVRPADGRPRPPTGASRRRGRPTRDALRRGARGAGRLELRAAAAAASWPTDTRGAARVSAIAA